MATDHAFTLRGRRESVTHQLANRPKRVNSKPDKPEQQKPQEISEEAKLAHKQLDRIRDEGRDAIDLARGMEHPVKMVLPDPQRGLITETHLALPTSLLVELLFSKNDDQDSTKHVLALRSLQLCEQAKPAEGGSRQMHSHSPRNEGLRLLLKAYTACIAGTGCRNRVDAKLMSTAHSAAVRAEAAYCLSRWQTSRAPRSAPTVKLPLLEDLNFVGIERAGAHSPLTLQQEWIGLTALLKIIRDQCMVAVPADGFDVTKSSVDPPRHVPAFLDLCNETSVFLQLSLLLALSSIRSQSGATPRDVIDLLLVFAEHSLRLEEESAGSAYMRSVDGAYYIAHMLLALSQVRTELGSGDVNGDLSAVAAHARAALNQDWANTRTLARIKRSQASSRELDASNAASLGPSRVPMPMFANAGLVTAASLATLCECDIQLIFGKCRRLPRFSNGQVDYSIDPFPSAMSPAGQMNYLSYFLPPGAEIGECLIAPGSLERTEGRLYAACSPTIRATACEAFIRFCFAQHLTFSECLKLVEADILRRTQRAATQAANRMDSPNSTPFANPPTTFTHNNVPVTHTAFLPVAILTVLAVLRHESNRNTRRQACVTLRAAAMDLPPRQFIQALSCDEPLRCAYWPDAQAAALPPVVRYQAQHLQALQSMEGELARLALQQLWGCITDSAEDQCVRGELFQLWLYVFPLDTAPVQLATSALPTSQSSLLVSRLQWVAPAQMVPSPLDAYTAAQVRLYGEQMRQGGPVQQKLLAGSPEAEARRDGQRRRHKHSQSQQNSGLKSKAPKAPSAERPVTIQPVANIASAQPHAPIVETVESQPLPTLKINLSAANLKNAKTGAVRKLIVTLKE